jgi:murein DD-endopeptidase MepM/ murein hydrolase activator NlpD
VALVSQGDTVASGQPVGRAGRSGRATGTHLHFEVLDANGRPVDPATLTKS